MSVSRVVIVNGKVAEEPDVEEAVEQLMSRRGPAAIHVTSSPGDARRIAREAMSAEEIVVLGGDGTLNEVISGLRGPDGERGFEGTLAVIPAGTANDFAGSAGIPTDSPVEAVAALPAYRPVALDLGRVSAGVSDEAEGSGALFVNVATGGFGAEISSQASEELKAVLGRVSYLVAGIAGAGELKPREATITAPGFERTLAFYLLAVGNGRRAGGGMPVCPDADPTDGQFDVTIVPEGTVGATIAEVLRKGLEGVGNAGIRFRSEWLEVTSPTPLQFNLDGEPYEDRRFSFEVRPAALRVMLPLDSPLLRRRPEATSSPPPSTRSGSAPTRA